MKMIRIALTVALISTAFVACRKEKQDSTLKVRMTDAPADWDEVNIDLKQVNVRFSNDTSSWEALSTNAGVYNLLGFQNGLDTLIAQGNVQGNTVQEIRLVLGTGNTIKLNGQVYPLTIPSGATSGLKIKVNRALNASIEDLLIDFDAALSIKQEGDGYKLRPVIRLK
jgi:hypothetical protein